jgi:steroid delta-isomerase-like uncharacterized protein
MSLEKNKDIVRRFVEAYNNKNFDLLNDLLAPDYFDHTNQVGSEGLKQLIKMAFIGMPDYHETIEDIIAEGEKVWIRVKATGTHTGEFMGIAPTGKRLTVEMVDIIRVVDGKIVEYEDITNRLDFLRELGVIEYTEKGKMLFQ